MTTAMLLLESIVASATDESNVGLMLRLLPAPGMEKLLVAFIAPSVGSLGTRVGGVEAAICSVWREVGAHEATMAEAMTSALHSVSSLTSSVFAVRTGVVDDMLRAVRHGHTFLGRAARARLIGQMAMIAITLASRE